MKSFKLFLEDQNPTAIIIDCYYDYLEGLYVTCNTSHLRLADIHNYPGGFDIHGVSNLQNFCDLAAWTMHDPRASSVIDYNFLRGNIRADINRRVAMFKYNYFNVFGVSLKLHEVLPGIFGIAGTTHVAGRLNLPDNRPSYSFFISTDFDPLDESSVEKALNTCNIKDADPFIARYTKVKKKD